MHSYQLIILITCITSIIGLMRRKLLYKYRYNPNGALYTVFTYAWFHADAWHLFFNMLMLAVFGYMMPCSNMFFTCLYLGGIVASCIPSLISNKGDYTSLGASGTIIGVVFSYFILHPHRFVFILLPAYIIYSWYQYKHNDRAVTHDAHLAGAGWGIVFTLLWLIL